MFGHLPEVTQPVSIRARIWSWAGNTGVTVSSTQLCCAPLMSHYFTRLLWS